MPPKLKLCQWYMYITQIISVIANFSMLFQTLEPISFCMLVLALSKRGKQSQDILKRP